MKNIFDFWGDDGNQEEPYNPLTGHCQRVYFVSTSHGRVKSGPKKGQKRKRNRWKEVEMIRFPRTGRCQTIYDDPRGRLDSFAEEIINPDTVPPHVTPYQYFLDWFRRLPLNGKSKKRAR